MARATHIQRSSRRQNTSAKRSGPVRKASTPRAPDGPFIQEQQRLGNRAVQRLLRSGAIQAKLTVGRPDDRYEREADRVADQVMRMPETANTPSPAVSASPVQVTRLQRRCAKCEEEDKQASAEALLSQESDRGPRLQRLCAKCKQEHGTAAKGDDGIDLQAKRRIPPSPTLGTDSGTQVDPRGRGGQPLPSSERAFFESRFGHRFEHVSIHTDGWAARAAAAVDAQAFTVGRHIVMGAGQRSSESSSRRHLLAHELTHVLQQTGGRPLPRASNPSNGKRSGGTEAQPRSPATVEPVGTPRIQRVFGCARLPDPTTGILSCVSLPAPHGCSARGGTCRTRGPGGILGCWCDGARAPVPGQLPGLPPATGLPLPPIGIPGFPPIGTPGPPSPGQPAPGPSQPPAQPPQPQQQVTDVTVANQRAAITYPVPSNRGAGGKKHFVTVAGQGPDVIVEATLNPAGAPAPGTITWTGATPDPANPARATVPRSRAAKHEVTATAGGQSASLTVWAVFASIRNVNGPTLGFSPPTARPPGSSCRAGDFCVWATVNFNARIFPGQIITDGDHPALEGARTVAPPGGNHPCGNPLAGGAPLRWDFSRQFSFAVGGIVAGACGGAAAFPNNNALGNDDSHAADEMNNPYTGGNIPTNARAVPVGSVGDYDAPSLNLSHAAHGVAGSTATSAADFREFVRLEYNRTWWLISHRPTWGFTFRLRKNAANRWVDDGSAVR